MYKKLLLLTVTMMSFFSINYADLKNPVIEQHEIGRYQMTHHPDGYLFMLDTSTGQVWRSKLKKNWVYHDEWTLQIPDSPTQAK